MKYTRTTISIPTRDLKRAFEFYRKGFGLALATDVPEGEMPEPVEFRLDAQTHLMIVPTGGFRMVLGPKQPVAVEGASEVVIGLSVEKNADLDAVVARATAAGATINVPPSQTPWGYSVSLRDPDGHIWMVVADR
jgi:uncharacterized glyoxalase superfamily protein PhnB